MRQRESARVDPADPHEVDRYDDFELSEVDDIDADGELIIYDVAIEEAWIQSDLYCSLEEGM